MSRPILPAPVRPLEPAYEDLAFIPNQAHAWNEDEMWDSDYHGGLKCDTCGEWSDCMYCVDIHADNTDCLRHQARERNYARQRAHEKALEGWEAQMSYYNELKEKYGYQ